MKRAKRKSMTLLKTHYDIPYAVYHKTFLRANGLNDIVLQVRK